MVIYNETKRRLNTTKPVSAMVDSSDPTLIRLTIDGSRVNLDYRDAELLRSLLFEAAYMADSATDALNKVVRIGIVLPAKDA